MSAIVGHGLLTRFPDLKVASVENGGDRVIPFLKNLADTHKKMPQAFEEDPIAAFKRNVYISPFHEDDIRALIDVMGVDHILFGSDFPHPEGRAEPCSYIDHLPADLSDVDLTKVMGGNLGRLMGVGADVTV